MDSSHTTLAESQIMDALREVVLSFPEGGASGVASRIGKPYSTMMRELNPHDAGAKLGVGALIALLAVTGDVTPVRILADACGFDLVPRPDAPDPDHAD